MLVWIEQAQRVLVDVFWHVFEPAAMIEPVSGSVIGKWMSLDAFSVDVLAEFE